MNEFEYKKPRMHSRTLQKAVLNTGSRVFARNDKEAGFNARQAQAAADEAAKMASQSDNARQIETFVQTCQQKLVAMGANGKKDKANTDLHAKARALSKDALEGADWTAEEKRAAAEALAEWLP